MATWGSFLSGALEVPAVLDPASVLELRNTAMLQPDGLSAVGGLLTLRAAQPNDTGACTRVAHPVLCACAVSRDPRSRRRAAHAPSHVLPRGPRLWQVSGATLESAFSHGHWTFNKLGCLDGYRSATTVVPQLGLALFAAAASTCDFYGDGDAVGFPIVSRLLPALETILQARLNQSFAVPHGASDYVGRYCSAAPGGTTVSLTAQKGLHVANFPGGCTLERANPLGSTLRAQRAADGCARSQPTPPCLRRSVGAASDHDQRGRVPHDDARAIAWAARLLDS